MLRDATAVIVKLLTRSGVGLAIRRGAPRVARCAEDQRKAAPRQEPTSGQSRLVADSSFGGHHFPVTPLSSALESPPRAQAIARDRRIAPTKPAMSHAQPRRPLRLSETTPPMRTNAAAAAAGISHHGSAGV